MKKVRESRAPGKREPGNGNSSQHDKTFLVKRTRRWRSDGSTEKGSADVMAHPLGQPRQSTRPLSTTTTSSSSSSDSNRNSVDGWYSPGGNCLSSRLLGAEFLPPCPHLSLEFFVLSFPYPLQNCLGLYSAL